MRNNARYVLDTNVLVSALLFNQSIPGKVFLHIQNHGVVLISTDIVNELNNVLNRKKFNRYATMRERERFLEALIRESELIGISEVVQACRDSKDNHILELAVSGKAASIITGDKDLLTLNPFREIPIVSPSDFLASLTK